MVAAQLFSSKITQHPRKNMTDIVCTACGYVGKAHSKTPGSTGVELILWICLIVPGLIYSVWRLCGRYPACPVCTNAHIIPRNSPLGMKFIRENLPELLNQPTRSSSPTARAAGRMLGRLIARYKKVNQDNRQ